MAKSYGFGSQCFQSLDLYSYFCCAALPLNLGGLGRQLALGGGGLVLSHRLLLASKVTPGTIYVFVSNFFGALPPNKFTKRSGFLIELCGIG